MGGRLGPDLLRDYKKWFGGNWLVLIESGRFESANWDLPQHEICNAIQERQTTSNITRREVSGF